MSLLGDTLRRVRGLFARDKEQVQMRLSSGATSSFMPGTSYDLLQSYGYDVIADYLRLEQDLMSRFVDYESMDDYGEVAATLNIYADDATQPDTPTNKRVWVDSPDKDLAQLLNDFLHRVLRVEEDQWSICRTMCKYGNDYEEIVVHPEEGVVALNHLPTHTVRRVEGPRGELYGFVQDFNRRIGYTPKEFHDLVSKKMRTSPKSDRWGPDKTTGYDEVVPFEPWQVAHFRHRGKHRRSIYGYCLAGDSRVWTTEGAKAIEDVRPGDRVLFRHAGMLRTSKVQDQVCSGTKPLFKLRTKHRELRLTAEHPVLRWNGGKNNQWVPVGELELGDKVCVATNMPQMKGPPAFGLELLKEEERSRVRFTERGASAIRECSRVNSYAPRDEGIRPAAAAQGITRGQLEELLEGHSSLERAQARRFFESVGLPFFEGATALVRDARLTLPDFVTADIARLWGFLLGDGWVTDGQVYFARGVNEDQNLYYEGLLRALGLDVARIRDEEGVERQSYVSSTVLVSLLRRLGWTDGAHRKRVPSWVYTCSRELREAFVQGFQDADGWETTQGPEPYYHIELCNERLLRDLKNLIDGLGWVSGNIRERAERTSIIKGREVFSGKGYLLYYRKAPLSDGDFLFEKVEAIEADGEGPVYDIEIAARGHNFVAEGMVVHNSVLEPARWVWKRLVLLEDAALIYRLQRAPERFAFYVDTGNRPMNEALRLLHTVRQQYKKKRYINPRTNKLDLKLDMLAQDEDIFIPVVNGSESTRVEVLGGPSWQHMEDIEYFLNKLFAALHVPKAYLSQEEGVNRAILSSEDVRFARTILRVQQDMRLGIEKICRVHLAAIGIPPDKVEFDVRFTVPNSIFELAQLEVRNARADFASRVSEHVSREWMLSNVYHLTDEEIHTVLTQRDEELIHQMEVQGKAEAAMQKQMGGGMGGMTMSNPPPQRPLLTGRSPVANLIGEGAGAISLQELEKSGREDRKQMRGEIDRVLRSNYAIGRKVHELRGLMQSLHYAVRK